MGPRNRFQGMNSASLCSLAGRYNNPIPTRCLAPIDFLKIPAQSAKRLSSRWNWDSPTPLAAGECAPPPFGPGGRAHSLAAKGVGESQFQRGDIHCGALYI